jgi:hypothetical protein
MERFSEVEHPREESVQLLAASELFSGAASGFLKQLNAKHLADIRKAGQLVFPPLRGLWDSAGWR